MRAGLTAGAKAAGLAILPALTPEADVIIIWAAIACAIFWTNGSEIYTSKVQ